MKWILDGSINLTEICEQENAHHISTIKALQAKGLSRADAVAFANFIGNEYVIERNGITDSSSEEWVTDEQYERLTLC